VIHRRALFAAVSSLSLVAGAAWAEAAPLTPSNVDELVVTGSRTEPKSRLETLAPVDVITAASLQKRGPPPSAERHLVTQPPRWRRRGRSEAQTAPCPFGVQTTRPIDPTGCAWRRVRRFGARD
jgi:hypothetical protein